MLKTCKYCGVVVYNHVCPYKNKRKKKSSEIDKFRSSKSWQKKREEIKKRDLYLCQVCIREIYNTRIKYNTKNISVHHNVPISENNNKKLDNRNLITVCSVHHEMCENNEIPREIIQKIINEQEEKAVLRE